MERRATQFSVAQISPTQISPTQISPTQINATEGSFSQIHLPKIPLSRGVMLQKVLRFHNPWFPKSSKAKRH
jgi:hypothetical protein